MARPLDGSGRVRCQRCGSVFLLAGGAEGEPCPKCGCEHEEPARLPPKPRAAPRSEEEDEEWPRPRRPRAIKEPSCLPGPTWPFFWITIVSLVLALGTPPSRRGFDTSSVFEGMFWLALLGLDICLIIWMVQDGKARRSGAGLAMAIVGLFIATPLMALIYLAVRPAGFLGRCRDCGNLHLEYARYCPHCEFETAFAAKRRRRRYQE